MGSGHAENAGFGIHGGEVIIGDIGYRDHIVFTALGDAVNVAARLEQIAAPSGELALPNFQIGELYVDFEGLGAGWGRPESLNFRAGSLNIPFGEEYLVRSPSRVSAALPWLYLRGVSTGDMSEALSVLLGEQALKRQDLTCGVGRIARRAARVILQRR